ncbi:MAG: hypothetical protein NTX24_04095 [Candidatus Pacearchaeota archaeon]|nr:hypothetical protein [Candidatus Pacearchaeota archaeon]
MTKDLANIAQPLIPLPEYSGLVARVHPDIASELFGNRGRVKKDERLTRVSDIFLSRYGIMGYVEYNKTSEQLSGIIEVPKKLTLILQLVDSYERFKQKFFMGWDLEKFDETLSIPQLQGVKFLDKTYYWALTCESSAGPNMKSDVDSLCESICGQLKDYDAWVDAVNPSRVPSNEAFERLALK